MQLDFFNAPAEIEPEEKKAPMLLSHAEQMEIQERMTKELGLPVTLGVNINYVVAKIGASRYEDLKLKEGQWVIA